MTKLNDTQSILLSTASQRDGGSLLPLPATLTEAAAATKAIAALIKSGLVEERETEDAAATVHRTDGDLRYGVYISPAGLTAIGAGDDAEKGADPVAPVLAKPERSSKTATVIALLQREEGATLPELIAATGWLPHTTRAALTGLRKKGHVLDKSKRDDATCYRIVAAA